MAGNARPLEELILEQYTYLFSPDGISIEEKELLDKLNVQLENLEKLKQNPGNSSLDLPLSLPASYWNSMVNYHQLDEIRSFTSRILVLQGERDYQVTMKDFKLWEKALILHENANFKSYPKLNHLFLAGEGPSYPTEYRIEGKIPDYVMKDIADWILKED